MNGTRSKNRLYDANRNRRRIHFDPWPLSCARRSRWIWVGVLMVLTAVPRAAAINADTTPILDEITIEGEIAMPQVLFITAREPFQYLDTHHRIYLPDAATHADSIPVPASLWIIGHERPSTLGAPRGPEDQG